MNKQSWLTEIPLHIGHYLSGFADGEGSFNVSLRKREDHTLGWQVSLMFNVAQRDKTVLALYKRHLGCGRLQHRKDGVWYYIVSNPTAITERVIPFFEKFHLLSANKKRNFMLFKKIAVLMEQDEHTTEKGLRRIIEIREAPNEGRGRSRKYSLDDYKQSVSENPQRLYAKVRSRAKRDE